MTAATKPGATSLIPIMVPDKHSSSGYRVELRPTTEGLATKPDGGCNCSWGCVEAENCRRKPGPSGPAGGEPCAWVEFTEDGLIRFWTSDPGRAEVEQRTRSLTKFSLAELIALVGRPRTAPPVTASMEEVARLLTSAKLLLQNAQGCAANHYGHDIETMGEPGWIADCRRDIEAVDALLSRKEGK